MTPTYEHGYFDGVNGDYPLVDAPAYRAGHAAGVAARVKMAKGTTV